MKTRAAFLFADDLLTALSKTHHNAMCALKTQSRTPTKQFRQFLKRHGLKHRKLHSLRHTSATLLLYGGVNIRQVQARLGHSEIETTQKYLHYLSDADAEAANILTNMIEEDESHNIDIGMAQ